MIYILGLDMLQMYGCWSVFNSLVIVNATPKLPIQSVTGFFSISRSSPSSP